MNRPVRQGGKLGPPLIRSVLVGMIMLAVAAFSLPRQAQASTSAGATIYNTVKVTYQSGTVTLFSTANVSVTVSLVAANPTVTTPANQTINAGQTATYNYALKSGSNGADTYTVSVPTISNSNIPVPTAQTLPLGSYTLWGGIALGSGAGNITVPFGTTATLVAGTSIVQIGANQYTVSAIAAGSAASTDGSGNLVVEVPATLTLTPVGAAPAITAGSVAAGTQVGEVKNAVVTITAATPTTPGTDGTYGTSVFTVTSQADNTKTASAAAVTTTVSSPNITVAKKWRNVTLGTTFAAPGPVARPGDTLEYQITVTNSHATASVTNATMIDAVPAYTAYVANSTRLNGITVAGDGASSPLRPPTGLIIDANGARAPLAVASGTLGPTQSAIVLYQVQIQ